jgi:hypothetical protein
VDSVIQTLQGSAASWHETKLFIEHLIAICHDTLHLLAGMAIWLALMLVSRRNVASWFPLLGTVVIAILNEAVDLWFELWPSQGRQLGEGARDVLATIAIPLILFTLARLRPSLFILPGAGRRDEG